MAVAFAVDEIDAVGLELAVVMNSADRDAAERSDLKLDLRLEYRVSVLVRTDKFPLSYRAKIRMLGNKAIVSIAEPCVLVEHNWIRALVAGMLHGIFQLGAQVVVITIHSSQDFFLCYTSFPPPSARAPQ